MPPTNRWRPVLERYIGLIADRVDGLGGHAGNIPPSFHPPVRPGEGGHGHGEGEHHPHHHHHERWEEHTGKISTLMFDHFGDFEGFILETEDGERRYFSRETEIRTLAERAWAERLRITVMAECESPERPQRINVRRPPAPFH